MKNKIQKGETLPANHVRGFRMAKEEVIYAWLKYISHIIQNNFITLGTPIDEKKLFQYEFSDVLWKNIRNFVKNLSELPLWKNNELSSTVFGGKQNAAYWNSIFSTGNSPQGVRVLATPINLMELLKGNALMCTISNKLKLCTCKTKDLYRLKNFWVLHRFVKGKNEMILGEMILPNFNPLIDVALNEKVLVALLNDGNIFDVAFELKEKTCCAWPLPLKMMNNITITASSLKEGNGKMWAMTH
ncbi:hypothetical protein [Pedobacter steynii]